MGLLLIILLVLLLIGATPRPYKKNWDTSQVVSWASSCW